MPRGNPSPKLAISVPSEIAEAIRAAATRDEVSISHWITEAVRYRLRIEDGLAAVAEYEAEYGAFTAEEMAESHRRVAEQMGWDE
ncbi:hypothetical protein [Nocardioides stalactiti]|uniref:hypothetical protein n=1 Tax=Nocardioides stalactiti TaxID=2755356 RepID=UPI0015FFAB8E|nr:hypothetical protein [Nocardioides stalactiti]